MHVLDTFDKHVFCARPLLYFKIKIFLVFAGESNTCKLDEAAPRQMCNTTKEIPPTVSEHHPSSSIDETHNVNTNANDLPTKVVKDCPCPTSSPVNQQDHSSTVSASSKNEAVIQNTILSDRGMMADVANLFY